MKSGYRRCYTGPVTAVIFDWAGTTIDFGSLAPIKAFCGLFDEHGVTITLAEARAPMGVEKREHIKQLLDMARVRNAWTAVKGAEPTEANIDALYQQFIPVQKAAIAERATLIPGARETFEFLRDNDIKIGANTGYSQEMISELRGLATAQGYQPDSYVCATDVPRGRPYPHMMLKNMLELEVLNVHSVVKVDDTLTGIEEGLNAGCWTVGIAVSGNEVGLDLTDWEALSDAEQHVKREAAYQRFQQSGAHYVIDTVAGLPVVIEDINTRLSAGEQP